MGWARASFLLWLGVSLVPGCSGKYQSRTHDPSPSEASGGDPGYSQGAAGGGSGPSTMPAGASSGGMSDDPGGEVTLDCGMWIRCDDSSPCASGEDCIALPGCERGICANLELLCHSYCGPAPCGWRPVGLTRIGLSCPDERLDGFESSGGSGGYPPDYPHQ